MSIAEELRAELKDALRQRDQKRADTIRQIETEITKAKTAKGFTGEVDDALYTKVIAAYVKRMDKARDEYLGLGERGAEEAQNLANEITLLSRWLPKKLDDDAVRELVKAAIAELGVSDVKQAGRLVGHLMKGGHEGLDGKTVNRIARELLGS